MCKIDTFQVDESSNTNVARNTNFVPEFKPFGMFNRAKKNTSFSLHFKRNKIKTKIQILKYRPVLQQSETNVDQLFAQKLNDIPNTFFISFFCAYI